MCPDDISGQAAIKSMQSRHIPLLQFFDTKLPAYLGGVVWFGLKVQRLMRLGQLFAYRYILRTFLLADTTLNTAIGGQAALAGPSSHLRIALLHRIFQTVHS